MTKAEEHLFDLSTRESRRMTTGCIADILYELYQIEDEYLQELNELESFGTDDYEDTKYVMDELIDAIAILAHTYCF